MGQRSQTFLRVYNPLKQLPENINKSTKVYKKWAEALGTDDTTVLAYHHQWLYGLTFPSLILKILTAYKKPEYWNDYTGHPLNPEEFMRELGQYHNEGNYDRLVRFIEFHTFTLSIVLDPWEHTRDSILEGFRFLNITEPNMRHYFNQGDNNDGICIVDCIEGKYAFMSIYGCEGKVSIPDNVPKSALDYVSAYYPTDNNNLREGYDDLTEKEIKHAIKVQGMVAKKYKDIPVLTLDEIKAIFPKTEI